MSRYREHSTSNTSRESGGAHFHLPPHFSPQPPLLPQPSPTQPSLNVGTEGNNNPYSSFTAHRSGFSNTSSSLPHRDLTNTIDLESYLHYHANSQAKHNTMGVDDSTPNQEDEQQQTVKILCFDLSTLSRTLQFLICSGSVFFFYIIYGYIMELIFRLDGFRPFGWYLTLLQFAWYSFFGIVESHWKKEDARKAPLRTYSILAFISVATIGLSNSSMGYLNFPTQQIFKSCKLIPVMIGGIIIQGKRYSFIDVIACISMCVGLALFTIADSTVSPNFNVYGIFIILLALCADAVIGNVQEKVLKKFNCSNIEMVLYSCSIGFLYILVGLVVTGNLLPAVHFCSEHPTVTYGYSFIFSIAGYLGLISVLTLVKSFGALVAVTVTTCRKALTIVLSFIFFTKPFTIHYLWSGLIVVLGILMNIYSKNHQRFEMKSITRLLKVLFRHKTKTVGLERII
ncbi:3' [Octopus vulgaris]|uniref:Adenosine 3'-phospho 5'-phosphosulfate transporter 2 n=1 Tax=Octopus vulgaris TaxID=6645 RepID=A0AA36F5U4_OCTVU|nr:3' [Octopus vulgaris]